MTSVVGTLPELQCLKLSEDAFTGTMWKTGDNEFKKLRFLKLSNINFEKWIATSEHFPILYGLVLYGCTKLQNLPIELGDIPTLHTIEVHDCSYGASICAIVVEQEQRDYGNKDLQVIISNRRWSKEQLVFDYKKMEEEQFSTEARRTNSSDVGAESRLPVHVNVSCDYCGMFPIVGDRYKCKDCMEEVGYDLCGNCHSSSPSESERPGLYNQKHTSEHEFELVIVYEQASAQN